jgi:cyanuric acid amidohydrolase
MHDVVILVGNSRFSGSPFRIGHAVVRDSIDLPALESVGLGALDPRSRSRLVNIFAEADASPDGAIRCLRQRRSTIPTSTSRATPARRSAD